MRKVALLTLATWFTAVAQPVPRSEYPQPQFQRELWLSLNGNWEFEFDDSNRGMDENWGGAHKFSRTIMVPYAFESKLSGIGDTSFHPWVWYRRTFAVPESWKGHRVLLHFGAVDYRARVWVNGNLAGAHEGGNTPFQFDITPLVKAGANIVTVRAEDPPTDRYIPRGKQYWEPKSRGIFYTRTSGIWQPVWLEAAGQSYLRRVRITAGQDGAARFDALIARTDENLEMRAVISHGGQTVAETTTKVTGERATAGVAVATPRLWSPGSPELYDVRFELRRGGSVVDRVSSYFGFRTVGVTGDRVTVNGHPLFLKFVLDQGYWPQSILTPPSDEAIQFDIKATREMGFNGARKHQKVEDPRFLYWADRMGFLVSGEMANAYLFDADYAERFTREWMEAVERDYNHPSVIIWNPINESWGVPDLSDPRQQNHLRALYTLTKSIDPTRLVIDNEGWQHTDMTDLFAIHNYARTGELLYQRYQDLGKPNAFPAHDHALAPGFRYNGTPIYLSEFGGIGYVPAGHGAPETAWGYSGLEKTPESVYARLRSLYEAIAKMPAIGGICYTQITDVEQEVNGLMTYDRKAKFDAKAIREINALFR